MVSFAFKGGMAPDLPEYGHEFLVSARNCYPGIVGYEPIKALSAVTAALGVAWKGGGAFTGADGTTALLAGSNSGLYRLTSTTSTNIYSASYSANWNFAQFGDKVICTNGGAPLKYTISTGAAALLGGSPPTASSVAIVRDYVFLAGSTTNQNRVYWSSTDNAEGWTIGTNGADIQDLPDGGAVTGLAGGEFGLAFQDAAIHIFEYVGSPAIFSRRVISNSIGALCNGGIAQHGRQTFFYSRRGFYKFIDGEVVPVGRNKVDRTFRTTYSVSEIQNNLRCSIDPERSLVIWSMPDRLWVYNFENDMWSDVLVGGIVGISTGRTASLTLEDIAVTYPSIENVTPVLDDAYWSAGSPTLMIALTDGRLYSFGSTSTLEARFRLPELEMNPGRETHVRSVRVIGSAQTVQISIDCRARMSDTPSNISTVEYRANGESPIRASGRYLQPEVIIPAGTVWSSMQGLSLEGTPGGQL